MDCSIIQMIIVGAFTLISSSLGFLVAFLIEKRKIKAQVKLYPSQIVYNRQTEFFDKMAPLFNQINGYITTLDVYLGESGINNREKKINEAKSNFGAINELSNLIEQYYMYLPKRILSSSQSLYQLCVALASSPDLNITYEAINNLFSLQNEIREYVGIDKLSDDLLAALGSKKQSVKEK